MADTATVLTHGIQQPGDINVNEVHEVSYWSDKFGVSEAELRMAVADVGVSLEDVAQQLGQPPVRAQAAI